MLGLGLSLFFQFLSRLVGQKKKTTKTQTTQGADWRTGKAWEWPSVGHTQGLARANGSLVRMTEYGYHQVQHRTNLKRGGVPFSTPPGASCKYIYFVIYILQSTPPRVILFQKSEFLCGFCDTFGWFFVPKKPTNDDNFCVCKIFPCACAKSDTFFRKCTTEKCENRNSEKCHKFVGFLAGKEKRKLWKFDTKIDPKSEHNFAIALKNLIIFLQNFCLQSRANLVQIRWRKMCKK